MADYDVAIIGAGPGGSTCASLLRKYDPALRVVVLEKARFPRPHIGESQLPIISHILHEMGCWDTVEGAGFPIKLGASYTWGRDNEVWDFDFYPVEDFRDEARPAKFEGQRRFTAFQVDRAIYDDILARHAASLGAELREGALVRDVMVRHGDEEGTIEGLGLDGGEVVTARHYVDASGSVGIVRRALDIPVDIPEELKNIATWSYWDDARWAVTIGNGGTRIQIRSLAYGWIWFIPISRTRASVGVVCPAEHYRRSGFEPASLYGRAIAEQRDVAALLSGAREVGPFESTKDWSQVCGRIAGPNWFLVGEAAGFADPILSAGLTLTHTSARDAAYTILELDRGEHPRDWLLRRYDEKNRMNIRQHIRFAQFWYATNGCFTELQAHCAKIAEEAGLTLSPRQAWQWIAQGGFSNESARRASIAAFDAAATTRMIERFIGGDGQLRSARSNVFRLNTEGATRGHAADLADGRIRRVECLRRDGHELPLTGYFARVAAVLKRTSDAETFVGMMRAGLSAEFGGAAIERHMAQCVLALDAMVTEGWVEAGVDATRPMVAFVAGGERLMRAEKA